jgi:hypothetical protein
MIAPRNYDCTPKSQLQLGKLNKVQLIREIKLHGSFAHRNIVELWCSFQVSHSTASRAAKSFDERTQPRKLGSWIVPCQQHKILSSQNFVTPSRHSGACNVPGTDPARAYSADNVRLLHVPARQVYCSANS